MATTTKKNDLLDPTNSPAQTFGKNSNEAGQTIEAKSQATLGGTQKRQNADGKSVASRTTNRQAAQLQELIAKGNDGCKILEIINSKDFGTVGGEPCQLMQYIEVSLLRNNPVLRNSSKNWKRKTVNLNERISAS